MDLRIKERDSQLNRPNAGRATNNFLVGELV